MISILLAEDHNVVRSGIRSLLEKDTDLKVAGEGVNGLEVLDLLANGAVADVILADMNMPGMSGLELIAEIAKSYPQIKVVILSMLDHEKYISQAFKAGASGYLLKNVSSDEMVFAIKHVNIGGKYLCSELSFRMLDKLIYANEVPEQLDVEFSKRELEILTLMAEGFTNSEIAEKLFTSKRTVEGHRQSLIDKTGARNTAALIKYSVLHGIIN
jgi:DNA-binding NarL/FixJ family response regulator